MKKSTILSFATAAAILASTAGTYAVWDKLTANAETTFTVNANITKVEDFTIPTLTEVTGETTSDSVTYAQDFTINVEGSAKSIAFTPTVTLSDGTAIDSNFIEVSMLDDTVPMTPASNTYTDTSITASNTYKIKVKVKDSSLNTKTLKVKIDANATKE